MCTTILTSKKAINIIFTLDLNRLAFLNLGDVALFHSMLCLLVSGSYSNIHSSPQQVRFSFQSFQDVMTHLKIPLYLKLVQQTWDHFGTDRFHPQVFRNDCPYSFSANAQFICYHLNSQSTVATHFLPHKFNIFIISAVENFPFLGSSSTSSIPSLNILCHLKTQALDIALFP